MEEIPGWQLKPTVGLRRTQNLKNLLMYQKRHEIDRETGQLPEGSKVCGHCSVCKQAIQSNNIKHKGIKLINNKIVTCSSRNVVYYLKCSCGLAYIGYTKRMIRTRIYDYKSRIWNQVQDAPLVAHFMEGNHSYNNFTFWIVEQVIGGPGKDIQRILLQREEQWIFRLNTIQPLGLNTTQDLSRFLWGYGLFK